MRWSQKILDEFAEHLIENVPSFDRAKAKRLFDGMDLAHPYALVETEKQHFQRFKNMHMPDPDDRHVLAAAVAAEADVLCTSNVKDFPDAVMQRLGIQRVTPDTLLDGLVTAYPEAMRRVHATSVARLRGATTDSTLAALKRAGAPRTSERLSEVLIAGHRL